MSQDVSQDVVDAVEGMMLKIIRDYHIYGIYGIAEIPDPNLSQLVEMLRGLKKLLDVLEDLNNQLSNTGIVNALINSKRKISLAEELLEAVKREDNDECQRIMLEVKKQR